MGDVDQKIEQAKIIMNENVFKDVDPEELAMKLNISYSWFRKVFKDYTGYAPAKYFQELKLRKAKQLLVGTSLSVKEISFMLDYKSTEHFWLSGNFWLVSFKISYLCLPLFHETRTTPSCHPSGCAYRQL